MSVLLEVGGLKAGYGSVPVLFGVDLEVGDGEVVALLGNNGAGKTTTLRALSGVIAPTAGHVSFEGRELAGLSANRISRRGLMHIPEGRGIFPSLQVGETLRLAARIAGVDGPEAGRRIDEVYTAFPNLSRRRRTAAGMLSGGEQQMLALSRALISRPRLLMIDEMSQGLAPAIIDTLLPIVAGLAEQGTAVLLVEQFVARALTVANRAYVLEHGVITYAGPADSLAGDAEFVRGSYLGEAPASARMTAANGGHGGERVGVTLPPTLLRAVEQQASAEGVDAEEVLRLMVAAGAAPRGAAGKGRGR